MVKQLLVSARATGGTPAPAAQPFPLWAGDLPLADPRWSSQAPTVDILEPSDSFLTAATLPLLTGLAQLAEVKRRRTPPPLPRSAEKVSAAPLAPPVESEAQTPGADADEPSDNPADDAPTALADHVQQLPCWLTSLVVHLSLVILLNSFVIYSTGNRSGGVLLDPGSATITCRATGGPDAVPRLEHDFLASSGDAERTIPANQREPIPSDEAPLVMETLDDLPDIKLVTSVENLARAATSQQKSPPAEQPNDPAAAPAPSADPATNNSATNNTAATGAAASHAAPMPAADGPPKPRTPARPASTTSAFDPTTTTRSVPSTDKVPDPADDAALPVPRDEQANDDIINRFIEYDLGRLQGEDARQAMRDFQALRPDAIPSLVRGLNRAAHIRGSCPVMVVSSKLEEMLRQTSDPSLIRYAIRNLGRGVPATAPHASRISGLRRRLVSQNEQVAEALRQQGLTVDPALLGHLMPLFIGDSQQLLKALGNSNSIVRQVAARQIEERLYEFGEVDRRRLARALVHLLDDPAGDAAQAAHSALVALAAGKDDFGPQPGAAPAALAGTKRQWNQRFAPTGDVSNERVAKSLLALARLLKDRGRHDAALKRYQDIYDRFPGTLAAEEAETELTAGPIAKP